MLANRKHGALYVGVTGDLERRISEHRQGLTGGFTSRYDVTRLVWYEEVGDIRDAIWREKAMKKWRRAWKVDLIEATNPDWKDLAADWFGAPDGSPLSRG
jgi:putative endonuclease